MFKNPQYNSIKVIILVGIIGAALYFILNNGGNSGLSGLVFNCTKDTPEQIFAITPTSNKDANVGSVYKVQWKTCKIPKTMMATISIKNAVGEMITVATTKNDGKEKITIPTLSNGQYTMYISINDTLGNITYSKESMGKFTITNPIQEGPGTGVIIGTGSGDIINNGGTSGTTTGINDNSGTSGTSGSTNTSTSSTEGTSGGVTGGSGTGGGGTSSTGVTIQPK